ncbi:pumilio homolog 5-like [Dendrobium catenatum]|uniref:pumilio homolog 5-like n=1 Tax=Dendrobium catenatum TaxID=906689 RepID=UPI0010A053E8|nr:pumilio homolog 5-like [Dendrobium catenatum]
MATEIPVRLIGSNVVRNWPVSMDTASFYGNQKFTAPSRSGSAPPSIEGSSVAIHELGVQQNSELDAILENLNIGFDKRQSEEQLRADPAYAAYYHSNVNLNPRIPPPLISQENHRLAHCIGENWRLPSLDDGNKRYLLASQRMLPTHKEEYEDDRSPRSEFSHDIAQSTSGSVSGQSASPLLGCYKSIEDLIQEDFPGLLLYNSQPFLSLSEQTRQSAIHANPIYNSDRKSSSDKKLSMNAHRSQAIRQNPSRQRMLARRSGTPLAAVASPVPFLCSLCCSQLALYPSLCYLALPFGALRRYHPMPPLAAPNHQLWSSTRSQLRVVIGESL